MGGVTAGRSPEAYEIAGINALQGCFACAPDGRTEDTLLPLLAMSVLSYGGALRGEPVCLRVKEIAQLISSDEDAAEFLNRAAQGFARCSDDDSAGELMEAASLRHLNSDRKRRSGRANRPLSPHR